MRERKLQRALLSVASSLLHATNEKTVYLPSHSHANYQTRPVPHADQVVPCMCCTVYSQLTCPLSNPDNLFGIGLFARFACSVLLRAAATATRTDRVCYHLHCSHASRAQHVVVATRFARFACSVLLWLLPLATRFARFACSVLLRPLATLCYTVRTLRVLRAALLRMRFSVTQKHTSQVPLLYKERDTQTHVTGASSL